MKSFLIPCVCFIIGSAYFGMIGLSDDIRNEDVVLPSLQARFTHSPGEPTTNETPDFQRHIAPLLGRLGCNGRACHGSFQGRGGFQLSLFGYDFKSDHQAMLDSDAGRVDLSDVDESLILVKPTDEDLHEGGKRFDAGSWQQSVLRNWIRAGAAYSGRLQTLDRLEVVPSEWLVDDTKTEQPLRVIAHWKNGTTEDVTPLCRFHTNDDSVADVTPDGLIRCIGSGDTHIVVSYDKAVVPIAVMRPMDIDKTGIPVPRISEQPIDRLIQAKLDHLRIIPAPICDDASFIRRASLDATGMLPAGEFVAAFIADPTPDKRERLIDELLATPGYAAWWATRFSDWTGNSEAQLNNFFPSRGAASKSWYAWLEKRLAENVPYDKIAEGIILAKSRNDGESYQQYCETMSDACRTGDTEVFASRPGVPQFWARANFKTPEQRAIGFAYTFLGVRIQCAQCHKHPFDRWSKDDFDQFAVLFSTVQANNNSLSRESIVDRKAILSELAGTAGLNGGELRKKIYQSLADGDTVPFPELIIREAPRRDVPAKNRRPKGGNPKKQNKQNPVVNLGRVGHLLGEEAPIALARDPRAEIMQWLRDAENPYFAKAVVNRVWANYFGIGIINPTDDANLGNPPSNAPLIDYLAKSFIDSGYDLKQLHRQILLSDAYQRDCQANATNSLDRHHFSRHIPRRLPAEVIRDAIALASSNDESAAAKRMTLNGLAIHGNGSLDYRPNQRDFALQVFGTSIRETNCDCDRSEQANLLQAIYLQNDVDIHRQLGEASGWVATVSVELTGRPHRITNDGGQGKMRFANAVREQLTQRVARYRDAPTRRQQNIKPMLMADIRRANERLRKFGLEEISFDSLVESAKTIDEKTIAVANTKPSWTASTIDHLIDQAYLRTLSRYPDVDERDIAATAIRESSNPGQGLESLMWVLLNTKEFVLSH